MIFVTGATGFIGSHLIQTLLHYEQPIRALYRHSVPEFNGSDKIDWVKADILDIHALVKAMDGAHHVYHCAALISFQPKDRKDMLRCNQEGTRNVVQACLENKIQKLVFVSSVSSLGNIFSNRPIDETMEWSEKDRLSIYGQSKYIAEVEVWKGIEKGLNAVIANPAIVLGVGDWNKRGSPEIFKTAYQSFPWYTEGICGFIDVQDVVKALMLLMDSSVSGQKFILCAENISYQELYTKICNEFGSKPPTKKITPLLAGIIWRIEFVRSVFSKSPVHLTKETASAALSKISFNNQKFLATFPNFEYTPMQESIKHICNGYKLQINGNN